MGTLPRTAARSLLNLVHQQASTIVLSRETLLGRGGAVELARSDWTELKDCTLASNSAYRGGMLYTDRSAAGFDVCTIRGNVAADGGGNLRRGTRSGYFVELRNHGKRCRLGSNRRKSWRSGLQQWSDLHDCVITANTA